MSRVVNTRSTNRANQPNAPEGKSGNESDASASGSDHLDQTIDLSGAGPEDGGQNDSRDRNGQGRVQIDSHQIAIESLQAMVESLRKELKEIAAAKATINLDSLHKRQNDFLQSTGLRFPEKLNTELGSESETTTAKFNQWKESLINAVMPFERISTVAVYSPVVAWNGYQTNSGLNLPRAELEGLFIQSSHLLWNLIWNSVDATVRHSISEEMKNEPENDLPKVLNFQHRKEPNFFHNCHRFLEKIESRYRPVNVWRIRELKDKERNLQYDLKQEPAKFIEEYRSIQKDMQDTIPDWTPQKEHIQAIDILARIPKDAYPVVDHFLNPDNTLTIKDVETTMRRWYDVYWKDQKHKQSQGKPNRDSTKRPSETANTAKEMRNKRPRNDTKGDSKRKECKYFKVGKCTRGQDCQYLHGKTAQGKSVAFPAVEVSDDEQPQEVASAGVEPGAQEGANVASNMHSTANLNSFLIDSGASSHFVCSKELMSDITSIDPVRVRGLNGISTITEAGSVKFDTLVPNNNGKVKNTVTLKDVRYCKNAQYNLISVAQIAATGCTVIMNDKGCYIIDRGAFRMTPNLIDNTILFGHRVDNIYRVKAESSPQSTPSKPTFGVNRAKRNAEKSDHEDRDQQDSTSSQSRQELEKSRKERQTRGTPSKIPKINQKSASQPEEKANAAAALDYEDSESEQ